MEIMNEDYKNYLNEINKTKEEIKSNVELKVNSIDDFNKKGYLGLLKYLKISEYLFHLSFENISNYDELKNFMNQL